jgi:hypothetical protein
MAGVGRLVTSVGLALGCSSLSTDSGMQASALMGQQRSQLARAREEDERHGRSVGHGWMRDFRHPWAVCLSVSLFSTRRLSVLSKTVNQVNQIPNDHPVRCQLCQTKATGRSRRRKDSRMTSLCLFGTREVLRKRREKSSSEPTGNRSSLPSSTQNQGRATPPFCFPTVALPFGGTRRNSWQRLTSSIFGLGPECRSSWLPVVVLVFFFLFFYSSVSALWPPLSHMDGGYYYHELRYEPSPMSSMSTA